MLIWSVCPNSEVFPFELIPPVSISPITDNFETYDSYDVTHVPDGWIIEYRLTAGYLYGCGSMCGSLFVKS